MNIRVINIGVIGYGIVGSATIQNLIDNLDVIRLKSGINLKVKILADACPDKYLGSKYIKYIEKCTTSYKDILNDPEIDIVVELIGGTKIAKDIIIESIKAKKSVVTANKALLAIHGKEIFELAKENQVFIGYEASVAGGIPIIRVLKEDLVVNNIEEICAIINGTCNYILTVMTEDNKPFDEVLKDAQAKGYAESDPTFDIDGIDAAHKITILSSIAFSRYIAYDKISVEGIRYITPIDIEIVKEFDSKIKLLAIAKRVGDKISVRVAPTIISKSNPLSSVDGVYNAVMVFGDKVGKTMHYGRGAGGDPTSSAVIADIVAISKSIIHNMKNSNAPLGFVDESNLEMIPSDEIVSPYYIRFMADDKIGVLAAIADILSKNGISIHKALQRDSINQDNIVPLVFMTHNVAYKNIFKAITEIVKLNITIEQPVVLPIED